MSKNEINITTDNLSEWMHSVGYFLPIGDLEISRFEKLHANIEILEEELDKIDPLKIINGEWKQSQKTILIDLKPLDEEIGELRMAARKHQGLPEHILNRIKKNQDSSGNSDKPEE